MDDPRILFSKKHKKQRKKYFAWFIPVVASQVRALLASRGLPAVPLAPENNGTGEFRPLQLCASNKPEALTSLAGREAFRRRIWVCGRICFAENIADFAEDLLCGRKPKSATKYLSMDTIESAHFKGTAAHSG